MQPCPNALCQPTNQVVLSTLYHIIFVCVCIYVYLYLNPSLILFNSNGAQSITNHSRECHHHQSPLRCCCRHHCRCQTTISSPHHHPPQPPPPPLIPPPRPPRHRRLPPLCLGQLPHHFFSHFIFPIHQESHNSSLNSFHH